MSTDVAVVVLFAVAAGVAIAARAWKVPYTVALVVVGLVLGATHLFAPPPLTKELLFGLFLPGLLFEAAFHVEPAEFWRAKIAILSLAVPGVVVAIVVTALLLTVAARGLDLATGFGLAQAVVFAAIIAATDPIAVVALFKSVGAPRRLAVLVESESLLNDGTAVVLFTLVLGIVGGDHLSIVDAAVRFVLVVSGGVVVGAVFGAGAWWVTKRIDDPMVEITLTTLAAYGSFATAELGHCSGVIASVVAGMICGHGARAAMSTTTRLAVVTFWEYLAFAFNSLVFLLIGFRVSIPALLASWVAIAAAYLAMTLARAALIALVTVLLHRSKEERIPPAWAAVIGWGGLRGALSMVLALGLPAALPQRELLVTLTFGVVVLSIVVQGLTMSPLLRRLGIQAATPSP